MKDKYGEVIVSWCPDQDLIIVVGEFDLKTEMGYFFHLAHDLSQFSSHDPYLKRQLASLNREFSRLDLPIGL